MRPIVQPWFRALKERDVPTQMGVHDIVVARRQFTFFCGVVLRL
jgi:hypothetical protein